MPSDEELQKGLRNIEEILQRLDDQAQNRLWRREHAPLAAPARAIGLKREEPPQPEVKLPETAPAEPAPVTPVEAPAPVVAAEPIAAAPEPEIVAVAAAAAPIKLVLPVEIVPPPLESAPVLKPAKNPFTFNKNILLFLGLGLTIAGGAYHFTVNSAAARYARAGELVKAARHTAAISAYTQIIARHAGSLEAAYSQYAIADIKAAQGDLDGAIDRYEKYLVAAPAGDNKAAQAKFNIAEIEFKQGNLPDAEFMYNNADIQASTYKEQAADRLNRIKAVNTQIAGARKSMAKDPARAVEVFTAVLAAQPGLKAAAAGLEEARKALNAANERQAARAAAREARGSAGRALKTVRPQPPPTPAKAAVFSKAQLDACNAVWLMEKIQGRLDADAAAVKNNNNCDALKESMKTLPR